MPVAPSTQTDSQTLNGFPALFFLAEEKPNLKNCQYPLKKKYPLNKKQKKAITDNKIINNEINYFELMPFFNCDDFTKETTEKKPITDNKIINNDYNPELTLDEVYNIRPSQTFKVMFNEPSIWQGYETIENKNKPLGGKLQN